MSPQALQRFVVRMLFDPSFVDLVYGDGPIPGLEPGPRTLLRRTDRRAWGTDPWRRSRTLRALVEEFPVSSTIASIRSGSRGIAGLDDFFSSESFHDCIQQRGTLAFSYGSWIARSAPETSRIEIAVARLRRTTGSFTSISPRGTLLQLAPGIEVLQASAGTLTHYQQVLAQLGTTPLQALLEAERKGVAMQLPVAPSKGQE
ncbi:MAG: hypothetical protein QGG40_16475, partial [Myxococcota bacterium]|nr:hypothetical protein [Myxococcota bacterium]